MFTAAESQLVSSGWRRELHAVQRRQQETSRRFSETLISLCGTYVLQMRQNEISTAFTDKTMLVFLEYIFQFFINKALTLKP